MAGQSSLVVRKPQVAFSKRLQDTHLRTLTVAQLRKKARKENLDVSRLTEKWEFVHVLVEQRTRGAQAHVENITDTRRRTIFDLPGEIRNKIYGYVLIEENPVLARYDSGTSRRISRMGLRDFPFLTRKMSKSVTQLMNMSWANRDLRQEVRGYFFAHNGFRVSGNDGASYNTFLSKIGPDARASITVLDLDGPDYWMYNYLYRLAPECTSLRKLTVRMHLGHLVDHDTYFGIRGSIAFNYPELETLTLEGHEAVTLFVLFPALQQLQIKCAFPDCSVWATNAYLRREKVRQLVEEALLHQMQELLQNKGVKVTISTLIGAGILSCE